MIWRVCGQITESDAQGRVVWRLSVVKVSTKVLQGSKRDFQGSKYIPTTRTWTFVNCPCPEQFEELIISVKETFHRFT